MLIIAVDDEDKDYLFSTEKKSRKHLLFQKILYFCTAYQNDIS